MSNKVAKRAGQVSKQGENQVVAQMMSIERSSILPPPDEMERYEKLSPGITTTLINTYQKQAEHRMELEKTVISSGISNAKRGQIFAFTIAMTALLGGFALLFLDKNILGITSILGSLAALVGVFIYGKKKKKDERIQKEKMNQ